MRTVLNRGVEDLEKTGGDYKKTEGLRDFPSPASNGQKKEHQTLETS